MVSWIRVIARRSAWLAALGAATLALAADAAALPPPLSQTHAQARSTGIITRVIDKQHYLDVRLDDALSGRIFERYLENLDPTRSYFLAADVEQLATYRHKLDDAIRSARLDAAFQIFNLFRQRLTERSEYALGLLDGPFDFSRDEDFQVDRAKASWARDREELDEIWRRRVKNDILNLRLSGRALEDAIQVVRRRYDGLARRASQFNAEDAYQVFMNAYTGSIEPHTAYLSPRNSENFQIQLSLSLEGIGAALQTEDEYTVVQRVIPGGPASASGQLQAQDRITAVGQGSKGALVDVVGWRLDDVVDLIRGPKGTTVRLEILPKGAPDSGPRRTVALVRDRVRLEDQAARKSVIEVFGPYGVPRRIGVIEIPTFYLDAAARARGETDYRSTARDVARLLAELEQDRVDGVLLDLRADGGGALSEAIDLTGLFISTGPVVQVRDANGKLQILEDADPATAYSGPLGVLVDRHSASASEIFAAAIQDYGRGLIIGEPTYGKGTVQSLLDLSRAGGERSGGLGQLKATVAQFFRVNGSSTQHRGVLPDVPFPATVDPEGEGERSLSNAIPWAQVEPVRYQRGSDNLSVYLPEVLARHRARVGADPGFRWLSEEATAQRAVLTRTTTSLLESRRRAERDAEQRARLERENRYRAARGLPLKASGGDAVERAPAADKDQDEEDIWLTEAAHVVADLIDVAQSHSLPELRTADGNRSAVRCVAEDCPGAPGY
jgi:carboxyl-terminal processing protease